MLSLGFLVASLIASVSASSSSFATVTTTSSLPSLPTEALVKNFVEAEGTCGVQVSTGSLLAGQCTKYCLSAISIQQQKIPCYFTVWENSANCTAGADVSRTGSIVSAGSDYQCFDVGNVMGCSEVYPPYSIMWTCDPVQASG